MHSVWCKVDASYPEKFSGWDLLGNQEAKINNRIHGII